MRIIFSMVSILFVKISVYSQISSPVEISDSIKRDRQHSFIINYRMVPELAKFETRYHILTNVNENERAVIINFSLQDLLESANYTDSTILQGFSFLKNNWTGSDISDTELHLDPKDIYYGAWRNKLIRVSSESAIKQSMIDGTNQMISLGYSDLGRDFLPFITRLMEENHLINYDHSRLYPGKASKGIVSSVRILNALAAQDTRVRAGVCRDIHETGRELLKAMCETWYGHFYPDKKIDFDDYIFLQSWTTNKSQHVTVSLIDPLNNSEIYELDWGRVIERENIKGFNSGRMYGNNYRIWQYDSKRQKSGPVDFKRTQFGKILDEDLLTREEYTQFNGIYDEEFYSDIRYHHDLGRSGEMKFSLGSYHPYQKYFLASWSLNTARKRVTGFLNHSGKIALQAAIHEDTRKKIFLYPQIDWNTAVSLMSVPRYISKFETPEYSFGNFSIGAFMNQQVDIFLIGNAFIINDTLDKDTYNSFSVSGDGNFTFSNGFNIEYRSSNRLLYSSAGAQARSCLLTNDIRLFSSNPFVLLSNMKIITPAFDLIGNISFDFKKNTVLSLDALFEFTNMDAVLFSGSVTGKIGLSETMDLGISIGTNDQIKGIEYFWYPVQRKWADFRVSYKLNCFSFGILRIPDSGTTFNISYKRDMF